MIAKYSTAFWVCAALVAAFVLAIFGYTVSIPLPAEDLQVYVNYIYFTSDDLVPEAFYGNGFGILPGEFVYKIGRKKEEVGGIYRPLTASLMALDYTVCGVESTCYHITNLLLQVACSIAVLALAWHLTQASIPASVAAALLFSVSPTHSLSQVVMLQRSDILCTLFYVLSVLFFARYLDEKRNNGSPRRDYVLCVAFMLLSLMSKEMAATLPIAFLLFDLTTRFENPLRLSVLNRLSRRHALFFGILVGYLLFRIIAFGGIGGYPAFALDKNVEGPAALMLGRHNITNAISGLNHLFGVASSTRLVRYSLLAAIFAPLLLGVSRRTKFAILMTAVAMLPVLTQASISPLYMFLSSAWFSVGIAASLWWLLERLIKFSRRSSSSYSGEVCRKRAALAVFAVLVGLLTCFFASKVFADISACKRRIEFAYKTAARIIELISPMPKGAKLFLVTPTMMESEGRVDFDPAIEAVLRVKVNDHSLKLWPIPLNVEHDELMEQFQAAALDMEKIEVDEKTYFLGNLSGELRLWTDILDCFRARAALRSLPGRLPGDYHGWAFDDQSMFGWTVTDAAGAPAQAELSGGELVFTVSDAGPVFLVSPPCELNAKRVDRFAFEARIEQKDGGPAESPAFVEWVSDTYPDWSSQQSRTVMLSSDGEYHAYVAEPGKDFNWVTANHVTRIRIRFPAMRTRLHLKCISMYYSGAPMRRRGEAPAQAG